MVKQMRWMDRSFRLDLPAGLFPNLVARLQGTPARLEELTAGLSREVLTARVEEGWSIQEHVGHLLDLEELWAVRLDELLEKASVLTAADVSNTRTHQAKHNARDLERLVGAFRASRMALVRRLLPLTEEEVEQSAHHPRLKQPMRVVDWALFAAEHDDHHLARIMELSSR
jgi:uncharacterized damage-inducible protein DinB